MPNGSPVGFALVDITDKARDTTAIPNRQEAIIRVLEGTWVPEALEGMAGGPPIVVTLLKHLRGASNTIEAYAPTLHRVLITKATSGST
mmetsp:Transcript_27462/g.12799  ORF Transcript_27462/g.12799 Transcript_27462/m.12799 type:complete len:89 (-) Transcript_27462:174-440(-)